MPVYYFQGDIVFLSLRDLCGLLKFIVLIDLDQVSISPITFFRNCKAVSHYRVYSLPSGPFKGTGMGFVIGPFWPNIREKVLSSGLLFFN